MGEVGGVFGPDSDLVAARAHPANNGQPARWLAAATGWRHLLLGSLAARSGG
jgi:hypothetical protein